MTLPSISILIVNYNTSDLTLACLRSIEEHPPCGEYEVIVVDNASSDDSVDRIRSAFPSVRLIESGKNLGFAGGNNLALEKSRNEILLLLNSDTEVHENTLRRLQEFFAERPDIAVVGGKHYKTDGSIQPTIKYFPRLSNLISESVFLHRLFSGPSWNEREMRLKRYGSAHEVEWLAGSYLAVRRRWYEKVGGLDEGFFMYSEDTDWCRRIRDEGGRIWYLPDSIITHHCGGSSGFENRFLFVTLCLSRDRYVRLHFSSWKAAVYRAVFTVGLLIRAAGYGICGVVDRTKLERAGTRVRAARSLYTDPLDSTPKVPFPGEIRTAESGSGNRSS